MALFTSFSPAVFDHSKQCAAHFLFVMPVGSHGGGVPGV